VASAAHEIAQPLQAMVLATSALHRLAKKPEIPPEKLLQISQQLKEAHQNATRLLVQLREFGRNDDFKLELIDVREPLKSIAPLLKLNLQMSGVKFEDRLPEKPLLVQADPLRIQQIFLNLINNARDASLSAASPLVQLQTENVGPWIRFRITNNGAPMPAAIQKKLFLRNFTTKERGKGTGLGLKICDDLVMQHHGRMLFSSGPEETVFIIDLPSAEVAPDQAVAGKPVPERPGLRTRRTHPDQLPLGLKTEA
jgi:two-component system C4-dicarboxylate transport sensor histidine kinase DctB